MLKPCGTYSNHQNLEDLVTQTIHIYGQMHHSVADKWDTFVNRSWVCKNCCSAAQTRFDNGNIRILNKCGFFLCVYWKEEGRGGGLTFLTGVYVERSGVYSICGVTKYSLWPFRSPPLQLIWLVIVLELELFFFWLHSREMNVNTLISS
jgi:hypothetical protein